MKRKTMKKMGIALAAAMILGGTVAPTMAAVTFNLSPVTALESVQSYVEAGRIADAMAIIKRLKAMGVTRIVVDGAIITLAELEQLISDGSPAAVAVLVAYVQAAHSGQAGFDINQQVAAFTSSSSRDTFPVSSAG